MPDRQKILENYVEPDITVEYLFIERAEEQIKPINDDQGYLMGFINIFISGPFKNDDLLNFKTQIVNELNYNVRTNEHFKSEAVDLNEYKFGLIDNDKEVTEFRVMDDTFFKALIESLRNLIIASTNFNIENFKSHHIFNTWFDKYTNRI
ncbi:MAG: hypothetical protein ACFFEY_17905 [Candidatus Thorarchaeota archaeon]